jgi:hypothetical protein
MRIWIQVEAQTTLFNPGANAGDQEAGLNAAGMVPRETVLATCDRWKLSSLRG